MTLVRPLLISTQSTCPAKCIWTKNNLTNGGKLSAQTFFLSRKHVHRNITQALWWSQRRERTGCYIPGGEESVLLCMPCWKRPLSKMVLLSEHNVLVYHLSLSLDMLVLPQGPLTWCTGENSGLSSTRKESLKAFACQWHICAAD